VRRDEQPSAACGRQQPACRGKQRAVTRAQLPALDLTTQDFELMAQHEQLDVLDVNGPAAAHQQPQQRHEREVDERQRHRAILSGLAQSPRSTGSKFWRPSAAVFSFRSFQRRFWQVWQPGIENNGPSADGRSSSTEAGERSCRCARGRIG
jgi:hypothetical protein